MKIAIIGIGATGGLVAGRLAAAGRDVTVVVGRAEQADRLRTEGLVLLEGGAAETVRLPRIVLAEQMPRALPRDFDLIAVATKSGAMPPLAEEAARHLTSAGTLLFLQNGLPEETAVLILPRRRVMGAALGWNAVRRDDRTVELVQPGETVVGVPPGGNAALIPAVVAALAPLGAVRSTENLAAVRWHKLALNSVINPLTAVGGLPLGATLRHRGARRVAIAILREAVAVWQALGIGEEPLGNVPRLVRFAALPRAVQHVALLLLGLRSRGVRPSMLLDVERGRQTEIQALNGEIVRAGRRQAIPTPANQAIVACVEAIEAGAARPSPSLYAELARAISGEFDIGRALS